MQYAHTKLMNAMFAAALQARADQAQRDGSGGGVHVSVVHPGAVKSQLGDNVGPYLAWAIKAAFALVFRSPEQAAPLLLHPTTSVAPLRGYIGDGNIGTPRDFEVRPHTPPP